MAKVKVREVGARKPSMDQAPEWAGYLVFHFQKGSWFWASEEEQVKSLGIMDGVSTVEEVKSGVEV